MQVMTMMAARMARPDTPESPEEEGEGMEMQEGEEKEVAKVVGKVVRFARGVGRPPGRRGGKENRGRGMMRAVKRRDSRKQVTTADLQRRGGLQIPMMGLHSATPALLYIARSSW